MNKSFPLLLAATALLQAVVLASLFSLAQPTRAQSAPALAASPVAPFAHDIAPLLERYCLGCHSGAAPKGDLDLRFKDLADAKTRAASDKELFTRVVERLTARDMPPKRSANQPTDEQRNLLINWIHTDVQAIDCTSTPNPGRFVFHRLNNREYANTLRDLLYLPADFDAAADLPADERGVGFDNNSDTLTLSPVQVEHYLDIAEKSVNYAMNIYGKGNLESKNKLNAPSANFREDFADRQAKVRLNIEVFAPRAFRRPLTKDELDQLMKFVALSFAHDGESFDKATSLAMRAALMSPEFLFRMERDPTPDGTGKVFQLDEFELASRLSYFLWSSMPDDGLFKMAREKKLRDNLDTEIKRMLKDPKALSLTLDFAGQWLEIRGLLKTPNCPPELLAAMKDETEYFFDNIIQEDRSIMDFLDADYTFLNETLAKHYGIAGVTGKEMRKVKVDPAQRGGIFTQASFLTLTSKPQELKGGVISRRPSPVNRGKWILENIFDEKIPPPPPGVKPLEVDNGEELKGTVRQIFEQHRADPNCASCHARMDPYGFALENYDGFGKWRVQDNKIDVDASGELLGKKFTTPQEFRTILASRHADFRRAFVTKMLSYALGRGLEDYDKCAIDDICTAVEKDGDRFSSVILNLVKSYPFQHARGSASATTQKQNAQQSPQR